MRRAALYMFLLIAVMLATTQWTGISHRVFAQSRSTPHGVRIGATRIGLNYSHVTAYDPAAMRAFVRTDSTSDNCLVTLAETNDVQRGITVFCGPREPEGLGRGILISVFYPTPFAADIFVGLTVYHEDAHGYGAPVLCDRAGC